MAKLCYTHIFLTVQFVTLITYEFFLCTQGMTLVPTPRLTAPPTARPTKSVTFSFSVEQVRFVLYVLCFVVLKENEVLLCAL